MEKSSNNFAFICEKYCITKLLSAVGLKRGKPSEISSQSTLNREEIVDANINNYKKRCRSSPLEVFLGKGALQFY